MTHVSSFLACCVLTTLAMPASSVEGMRWQRRVVLMASPGAANLDLTAQQKILRAWQGGNERDVSVVEVVGADVVGATDSAQHLRAAYSLPTTRFEVILIGKDGGVKLRSAHPFSADTLTQTIDAMPMRRAGEG